MPRGRTQPLHSLNTLEERCTPAGTVVVATGPAGISIKGDGQANEIRISPGVAPNSIKIEGINTAISGTAELDAANQKVNIRMGADADKVSFAGNLNLDRLTINLGTGNDELNSTDHLSVLHDVSVLHQATPGVRTTSTVNLASQAGEQFTVGDDNNPSKFSYQSTGAADDTLNVGAFGLLGESSQVRGEISASLASGNNRVDVKALSLGSLAIQDTSTVLENFVVNVEATDINGDLSIRLGRGSGVANTSITSSIIGSATIRNGVATQPVTVGVVGNTVIHEALTVSLAGASASLVVQAAGVLGNVSVTNRASASAYSDVSIGTITGSSYLNATQPASAGTTATITNNLRTSFIQNGLRVTSNGPGKVNTSLSLGTVNVGLQATSRADDGDLVIASNRINGDVRVNATGLGTSNSNVGSVTGNVRATITGTTFGSVQATEMKSLKLTISGASVATVDAGTVLEGFTVSSRNVSSTILRSNASIAGATKINVIDGNLLTLDAVEMPGDVSLTTTRTNTTRITITGAVDGSFTAKQLPGVPSDTFTLSSPTIKGPASVSLYQPADATIVGVSAQSDLTVGVVGGQNSKVTISGSAVTGNLNLNQSGAASSASVADTSIGNDLVQKATGMTATVSLAGGNVDGKASFAGGNNVNGSLQVFADDITIGSLSYVGGAGQNVLSIDTDELKLGQSSILGDLTVTLGGGDDQVQFGDLLNGLPSAFEFVNFAATSKISLNGGPGTDRFLDFNSNYAQGNLTLVSIDHITP